MPWEELKKANIETVIEKLNEEKQKVRENGDGVNGEYGYFKAEKLELPQTLSIIPSEILLKLISQWNT